MYDLNISFHTLYFIGQMEYNNISIAVFTNLKQIGALNCGNLIDHNRI